MEKQKIRIIKKNNDFSLEYQPGDIFTVDSTWYGGVNVTSRTGIPLSLDREEYELYQEEEEPRREIDRYSYHLGAMDSFCEMVAAGVKKLAMSHPCATKAERDLFLPEVKRICESYGILFYPEDEAFLTDLFPEELNRGTYNYLFYSTPEVLDTYLGLKEEQKRLKENGTYTRRQSYEVARKFGRLLSYTEEGIERLIEKTDKQKETSAMADQKNQGRCQEVDNYIAGFETPVRERLEAVRSLVLETAAGCGEKLSWGAPTYYLNGYLLQFAAYKNHLGFYTTPATLEHFKEALSGYKTNEKNTVQFPHNKELPLDLIKEMILFRMREKEVLCFNI